MLVLKTNLLNKYIHDVDYIGMMQKISKSELLIVLEAAKAITLKKNLVKHTCKVIFAKTNCEQKIRALLHVKKCWNALSVKTNAKLSESDIPSIQVLSVATKKDFDTLPFSLKSVISSSKNRIEQITVISPAREIPKNFSDRILFDFGLTNLNFVPEEIIISESSRQRLYAMFGSRYGWVLQQLLTVKFCLDSDARGVLVVDADTVLLKKLQWLDKFGSQLLMPSLEFHPPYCDFLNRAFGSYKNPRFTFITHHMLIQPDKLRAIFSRLKIGSIEELIDIVEKYAVLSENSAVCLEFEIYAQFLLKFFPKNAKLVKFSNIGLPNRLDIVSQIDILLGEVSKGAPINSISYHDYLRGRG